MYNDSFENIPLKIPADGIVLNGDLHIPNKTNQLIIFVHGSGSSRFSPRNREVAHVFNQQVLATLLFDLLTEEEEIIDEQTRELCFNIPLLSERLITTTDWLVRQPKYSNFKIGYYGASTGAAAAIIAAAQREITIKAIVSRGGRPNLANNFLQKVKAPTLLIVGGWDTVVIELNEMAKSKMQCEVKLEIVSKATHLFEEPGKLEEVTRLAGEWFLEKLGSENGPNRSPHGMV